MRRVLVPLDGTDLAEAVLPDARRLAGPDGEIVLIRNVSVTVQDRPEADLETAEEYLNAVAQPLRAEGVAVEVHALAMGDAASAIDQTAQSLDVDMIALATHGRDPAQRLRLGSVAWRVLLRSTVPVLLRHVERDAAEEEEPDQRQILVPLDGSPLAEKALPLAQQLAGEWRAALWLVRVVADPGDAGVDTGVVQDYDTSVDPASAEAYLDHLAGTVPGPVQTRVFTGPTVETLIAAVGELGITDIVMTTHGRTGMSRVIVGSIADALIHHLRCLLVVIPVLALMADELEVPG
jgi:nucleotide-binding universal stress UspA family protein